MGFDRPERSRSREPQRPTASPSRCHDPRHGVGRSSAPGPRPFRLCIDRCVAVSAAALERHAGAGSGPDAIPTRRRVLPSRPLRRAIRSRTSPSTRSAARPSWPDTPLVAPGNYLVEGATRIAAIARRAAGRRTSHLPLGAGAHLNFVAICSIAAPAALYGFEAISRSTHDLAIRCSTRRRALFDANSTSTITRAMDYFDLSRPNKRRPCWRRRSRPHDALLRRLLTSDWLFPTLVKSGRWLHARDSVRGQFELFVEHPVPTADMTPSARLAGISQGLPLPLPRVLGRHRGLKLADPHAGFRAPTQNACRLRAARSASICNIHRRPHPPSAACLNNRLRRRRAARIIWWVSSRIDGAASSRFPRQGGETLLAPRAVGDPGRRRNNRACVTGAHSSTYESPSRHASLRYVLGRGSQTLG